LAPPGKYKDKRGGPTSKEGGEGERRGGKEREGDKERGRTEKRKAIPVATIFHLNPWFTHNRGHLQVKRVKGKVRQPETDVLPLCNKTN